MENLLIILFILGLSVFLFMRIYPKIKNPDTGSLVLVNGGVKTGKTTLSVHLAISEYKRAVRAWYIRKSLCQIFRKELPEKPLLYSNIPLKGVDYVLLSADLILRKKRFAYRSIIYIDEASLVADKNLYKFAVTEGDVTLFCKLIAHETRGGKLFLDTQSIGDLSVAVRRNISSYLYVHHLIKWIPFVLVSCVREERFSEDNASITNAYNEDVEDTLKYVLIPKSVWKRFDCYCYSKLTDDLPMVQEIAGKPTDLRTDYIINLKENNKNA